MSTGKLEVIRKDIEVLRKRMISIVEENGYDHLTSIAASRDLDRLLNRYDQEKHVNIKVK